MHFFNSSVSKRIWPKVLTKTITTKDRMRSISTFCYTNLIDFVLFKSNKKSIISVSFIIIIIIKELSDSVFIFRTKDEVKVSFIWPRMLHFLQNFFIINWKKILNLIHVGA